MRAEVSTRLANGSGRHMAC